MIEKIVIKNKAGKSIDLTLEEFQELKSEMDGLEAVKPEPYPTYFPTTSPTYPGLEQWRLTTWPT